MAVEESNGGSSMDVQEAAPEVAAPAQLKKKRGSVPVLILFWYLLVGVFFNPRMYLWNAWQVRRLRQSRKARFIGSSKLSFLYPLIPMAVVFMFLHRQGVPSLALGFVSVAVVVFLYIVIGANLGKTSFWPAVALIALPTLALVVLQLGYKVEVSSALGDFFLMFEPEYPKGWLNLLAAAALVIQVVDVVAAFKTNSLGVNGNSLIPHSVLGKSASLNAQQYTLVLDESVDYAEAIPVLFGSGNLYLVPQSKAGEQKDDGSESYRDAVAIVRNVHGASQVKAAIDESTSVTDVKNVKE